VRVNVSVSGDFGAVVGRLEEAGLRDAEPLALLGIVTGDVDDPEPLRDLDGVEAVEASRDVGF
jgi:hypothetical protein